MSNPLNDAIPTTVELAPEPIAAEGCSSCEERKKSVHDLTLTVGMAVFDEFPLTAMTIQSLRMHHPHNGPAGANQIIVVDNNPKSRDGERLRAFCSNMTDTVKYIPFTDVIGTSAPRDLIFKHATSRVVCVIDPHIELPLGTLQRLRYFSAANPDNKDLWQGPLLLCSLQPGAYYSHMEPTWGSDYMFGKWGNDPRAMDFRGDPFEIPMHGLGLFACHRDAWPGFPSGLKGFGGEEGMIHEAFRQAGHRTLCLPFLRWWHLFRDEQAVQPYQCHLTDRFRNYLIWHKHLAIDPTLLIQKFTEAIGASLVSKILLQLGPGYDRVTLDALFQRVCRQPSDINEHCGLLASLAKECNTVTEFGVRTAVSTTAFLAGRPKSLRSYDINPSAEAEALRLFADPKTSYDFRIGDSRQIEISETDMLFIDTWHTADQLSVELERHHGKVRRWIVLHDTSTFGRTGEDGKPGLLLAIRRFCSQHPEWIVKGNWNNNNGLMILSKDPADSKPLPSPLARLFNYGAAYAKHQWAGKPMTTAEQFTARTDVCWLCDFRTRDICSKCGCPVEEKAMYATEDCPEKLWPLLTSGSDKPGEEPQQSASADVPEKPELLPRPEPLPKIPIMEEPIVSEPVSIASPSPSPSPVVNPMAATPPYDTRKAGPCEHKAFSVVANVLKLGDREWMLRVTTRCTTCNRIFGYSDLGNVAEARLSLVPLGE